MADRRVNVQLTADANQYMATLAKAAAATEQLSKKVDAAQQKLNNAHRAESAAAEQVRVAHNNLLAVQRSETASAQQVAKASRDLERARVNLADKTYDVEKATRDLTAAQQEHAKGSEKLWRDEAKRQEQLAVKIRERRAAEAAAAKKAEEDEKKKAEREAAAEKRREEADKRREAREAEAEKRRQERATKAAMAEVERIVAQEEADKKALAAQDARDQKAADKTVAAARKQADADAKAYAKEFKTTLERADQSDELGRHSAKRWGAAFNREFQQRKIFITSVIAGALTAGAPLLLSAAAMLFGGIAGIAGAQALDVKKAWSDLGQEIARGTVQDAAVIIPELEQMAGDLGESFENLRPQIRAAFEATAPLLKYFSGGLSDMATNAMPGFVSALQKGEPVMAGFQSFLGDVGAGLGDMFSRMAEHSEAAGDAFADWGDLFGEILPLLGELLGQGAELANIVLPPLTGAFSVLTDAVEFLGPLLPVLLTGFLAFKGVKVASDAIGGLASGMERLGTRAGIGSDKMGRMSAALGSVSYALPIFGAALAVAYDGFTEGDRNLEANIATFARWERGIAQGGATAAGVSAEIQNNLAAATAMFGEEGAAAVQSSDQWVEARERGLEVEERRRDSLSRSQRAAEDLAAAEYNLDIALNNGDPTDDAAAIAAYEAALLETKEAAEVTQTAIEGVTSAMVAQGEQALAAIDKSFAYRKSEEGLRDAQDGLKAAIEARTKADSDSKVTAEDKLKLDEKVRDALFKIEEQNYAVARAWGEQQASMSGLEEGTDAYTRLVQEQTLKKMYELRDAAGPEMKAAIQQQIDMLELNGVKLEQTTGRAQDLSKNLGILGFNVTNLPGGKFIDIEAPTEDQKRRIEELGIKTETLPNGNIRIDADTWPAHIEMDRFLGIYNGKVLTLDVKARIAGGATVNSLGVANGGLIDYYANGGTRENHTAQIAPAGSWRVWAEPETGGEAYIPLSPSKRQRSVKIWQETGRRLNMYANGGIPMYAHVNTRQAETDVKDIAQGVANSIPQAGPLGNGGAGGSWQALWAAVHAAFPNARKTSDFRPGDPGGHGRGKAVDVAGSYPGAAAQMLEIDRWAARTMGRNLKMLIHTPGVNLYNGSPHTFNRATQADHWDHVHLEAYDTGGIMKDGTAGINLSGFPERVLNPAETRAYEAGFRAREFSANGSSGASGPMTAVVNARVFIGTREITDIARVQAEAVLVSATNRAERNARSAQ